MQQESGTITMKGDQEGSSRTGRKTKGYASLGSGQNFAEESAQTPEILEYASTDL
jgi:hypothetical protein